MSHLSEEDLVLIYYNEPGISRDARAHLAACQACRMAAESLARTLDVCNEWDAPRVDAGFGREMWIALAPRLDSRSSYSRFWIAAAVAAVVIAAFFAERVSRQPGPPMGPTPQATAGPSRQARERILRISLADHLDRAEMLLTEVANMSDADSFRLASERTRAKDIVNEDRLMRQTLANQGNDSLLPIVEQVGRLVLEVANVPDRVDAGDIQEFKRRIDSESLLFKVRIIESNLRANSKSVRQRS
jgi:hypothetical protein